MADNLFSEEGVGVSHPFADRLKRLHQFADLLDSRFQLPGTRFRFGIDPLLGLLPGIGDGLSLLLSLWIVLEAHQMGASKRVLSRMGINLFIDTTLGAVPLLGDLFDAGFKANRRNLALLIKHLMEKQP